jgi:glyoxylase-like metal-dependent hydrolase (beta-lactamase superfamily II)
MNSTDFARALLIGLISFTLLSSDSTASASASGRLEQPDPERCPDIYLWMDTCNVYVLCQGDSAVLIDFGDGSVLDHLAEIGVKQVEWVLFTHHHREQCQGFARLKASGARIAAPAAERALFERPADFRKMRVSLDDAFTIHGSSYVRPPIQPIGLDRTFGSMDTFTWRGYEFWCLDTRGNSPGAMSYLLKLGGRWLAFSGDLMLSDARMHTWFDTEWDYGFAAGIYAMCNSAALVASFEPIWLLPSHGPAVREPRSQLEQFQVKLRRLARLLVRGYEVNTFSSAVQDKPSKPTAVPHVWQVTPHLFKFKGPNFYPNFSMILADTGHALVVDCGLLDEKFLDDSLELMRQRLGLKKIDAVIVTHMHGDHFLQVPYLRQKWDAQVWALDRMGPVCEHPERFDYAAPIQAYGANVSGLQFDQFFKSGETFEWEGYKLTVDWMPGQTEFALCLQGVIDGRKVAFTGDNIFGDPADANQTGHEAVVAHNSAVLEEGYIFAGEYLKALKPDLLIGGHSYVMDQPAGFIERFSAWSYQLREALRSLSCDEDYRYWFDLFWVRAEPYRIMVHTGEGAQVQVHVRNFRSRPQTHRIEIHTPPGLVAEPVALEGTVAPETRQAFPIRLRAAADAKGGVSIVAFDVTLDGQRRGEMFDCIVDILK